MPNLALPALLAVALIQGGCAAYQPEPSPPPQTAVEQPDIPPPAWREAGVKAYGIVADSSRLTAQIYRAGPLADAGHNHTAGIGALAGCALVNRDDRTWVAMRIPVEDFEVDREADRQLAGENFAGSVSTQDAEATRNNMLSGNLLDATRFPYIRFSGVLAEGDDSLEGTLTIRGNPRAVVLPVALERAGEHVMVRGRTTIKQTDFGITPFSVLMGMLQVADRVDVKYRLLFRRDSAGTACGFPENPWPPPTHPVP